MDRAEGGMVEREPREGVGNGRHRERPEHGEHDPVLPAVDGEPDFLVDGVKAAVGAEDVLVNFWHCHSEGAARRICFCTGFKSRSFAEFTLERSEGLRMTV